MLGFQAFAQTAVRPDSDKSKSSVPSSPPGVFDVKPALIDMFKKSDIEALIKSRDSSKSNGGWGSSGGGSGVACFKDLRTAQLAGHQIEKNQILSPELLDQVTSLETLEYWEWKTIAPFKLALSNAKNTDEILKFVHFRVAQILPLFIYRSEQAGQLIQVSDWDPKLSLPRINDARPARPLPEKCRQVQLAARFAKDQYTDQSGPSKKIPVVKVELNRGLYAKLNSLNQAILILHEQLYLLGQMTGYKNSDDIRGAVMLFFSADLGRMPGGPSIERYMLKEHLIQIFGDYLMYFGEDLKLTAQPFSQESRFNSYYMMLNSFREKVGQCQAGNMPESEKIRWRSDIQNYTCKDYVMNPDLYKNWLTDEMAFIYISSYMLDFSIHEVNSEFLIVPFAAGPMRISAAQEFLRACNFVSKNIHQFVDRVLPDKMVRYCEGATRGLSPTEKGRN